MWAVWSGVTPCARITTPSYPGTVGYRSAGYGIYAGSDNADIVIRDNTIRRVAKYSIGLKAGSLGGHVRGSRAPDGRAQSHRAGGRDRHLRGRRQRRPGRGKRDRLDALGRRAGCGSLRHVRDLSPPAVSWRAAASGTTRSAAPPGSDRLACLGPGQRDRGRSHRRQTAATGTRAMPTASRTSTSGATRAGRCGSRTTWCATALARGRSGISTGGAPVTVKTTIRGGSYESGPESGTPMPFKGVDVTLACGVRFERTWRHACVEYDLYASKQNPLARSRRPGVP